MSPGSSEAGIGRTKLNEGAVLDAARAGGVTVTARDCWLAWSASGETVVSGSAPGLALANGGGWLDDDHPVRARLRGLAGRAEPMRGLRFERFRLPGRPSAEPVLIAIRVFEVAGERIVLTIVDPGRMAGSQPSVERPGAEVARDGAGPRATDDEATVPPARRSRFVWRTNADNRLVPGSGPPFAGRPACVEGSAWAEIVDGPAGTAVAGRRPFGGLAGIWRDGEDGTALAVAVSGVPVWEGGAFAGFRGFALYATADLPDIGDATGLPSAVPAGPDTLDVAVRSPATAEGQHLPATAIADPLSDRTAEPAEPPRASVEEVPKAETPRKTDDRSPSGHGFGLIPAFHALLDASLSGMSDLFAGIPRGRSHAASPTGGAAAAAPPERAGLAPPRPVASAEALGPLTADVGARLGTPRAVPLVAIETAAPAEEPAGTPPAGTESGHGPVLSLAERGALSEIARALGASFDERAAPLQGAGQPDDAGGPLASEASNVLPMPRGRAGEVRQALDQLPLAALVHVRGQPLFANACLLDLVGAADLAALPASGWVVELMRTGEDESARLAEDAAARPRQSLVGPARVEAVSAPIEWAGRRACLTLLWRPAGEDAAARATSLELELSRRDERVADLQAFLDMAGEGVVKLDGAGRIVAMTRAAETMFGHAENEIAGEQISVLFGPESRADAFALAERARIGADASAPPRPLRAVRRDGTALDLGATARRVGPPDEGSVVVALADLSRERQMEASLGRARRELASAHRLSGDILARVSHDIRSPLTAIIGFADLILEERLGPLQDGRMRPYLEGIRSSGLDVVDRVDEFRRYAEASSGRMALSPAAHDLNEIVGRAVMAVQGMATRERVVLRTSLVGDLRPAWLDDATAGQAVVQLLSGAIALTPAGGQVIVSTAKSDGAGVSLRVRAKDSHLAERDLDAALNPFGMRPDTLVASKNGLGLALARALFTANGANVGVASSLAEGTLFEISLPAVDRSAQVPLLQNAGP